MLSAVFRGPESIDVVDGEAPACGPRDVVVQVEACGVCGSDVASYLHGHYVEAGQVMGHELCGTVAEVGADVAGLTVGTRVAVRPMRSCGDCGYCREGSTHLCAGTVGRSLGYGPPGGFGQRVLVPDARLGVDIHPVEKSVSPLDLMWAEPLAVALHAVRLAGLSAGRPVIVLGGGSVGLCVAAAAIAEGCAPVTVVEPRPERRAAATSLGAEAVDPAEVDACVDAPTVIDCSGASGALRSAVRGMRPGGRLVLVGLGDDPVPWGSGAVEIVGSFAYTDPEFVRAVELIATGRVRLSSLVSATVDLYGTADAIARSAADPRVVKVAITPNGPLLERTP
jgi:2-desacetyl-2-hydroxyethyl bacteriochlorophyllide A dehydrogenase